MAISKKLAILFAVSLFGLLSCLQVNQAAGWQSGIPFYLPVLMRNVSIPVSGLKIAFVSERDGNPEIYLMNSNGSGQTRLTNNPASDWSPQWSPDGSQIAFRSDRDGNMEIFVMNTDGLSVTSLTHDPANVGQFAYSPDGSKIAFNSDQNGAWGLYVMDADGANVIPLANQAFSFSWSPDGTKLALAYDSTSDPDIYSIQADGTGLRRITTLHDINARAWGIRPAWSPDGNKIAFNFCVPPYTSAAELTFMPPRQPCSIYIMNADGSEITPLAAIYNFQFAWSPDGKYIGFVEDPGVYARAYLYTVYPDGSNLVNLTPDSGPYWDVIEFAWSPVGDRIAFATGGHNEPINEIYLMNVDGSNQVNLTDNPQLDYSPSWQPYTGAVP